MVVLGGVAGPSDAGAASDGAAHPAASIFHAESELYRLPLYSLALEFMETFTADHTGY